MRDAFYTILVVWIIWRIVNSISTYRSERTGRTFNSESKSQKKQGDTSIEYIPPTERKYDDDDGEYVDYEEIK